MRCTGVRTVIFAASMKVPPKRKGNAVVGVLSVGADDASMKVPPKRKGNVGLSRGREENRLPQ